MLRYHTFFFDIECISSRIKHIKQIFFDIESKQKHLKMLNTDRKENKNVKK